MKTAQPSHDEGISAVSSFSMHFEGEKPAFIINPLADKRDLLSWCQNECQEMEHLASAGHQEVFAGDCERTVKQLWGRLEVLSTVLHRVAELDKMVSAEKPNETSMH